QCESRFTVDGKPGEFEAVIGLSPQTEDATILSPTSGTMFSWEVVGDLGLGTAVFIDPARTAVYGDANNIARTDETGYVRWFAGYAWEGQGEIASLEGWKAYLADFAKRVAAKPFADHHATLTVHTAEPPPAPLEIAPVDGVSGAFRLMTNGGWCWYQDPRAIVLGDGRVVFNSVAGATYGGIDGGDLYVTTWNPKTNGLQHFELADKFEKNDHAAGALLELPDGRIHAVYGRHVGDRGPRWRTTVEAGAIGSWTEEATFDIGARYSYTNLYRLSAEAGRLYNFSRTRGFNPNCTISDDGGKTWKYGWRLLSWTKEDLKGDPKFTGIDGCRPYVRYAGNGRDEIHFITTEDHPRAYDNSIWHGYYKGGKLHDSTGKVVGEPGLDGTSDVKPTSFSQAFAGAPDRVAWGADLELDAEGRPYCAFSVQVDGAKERGKRGKPTVGQDHRYWYARFDGEKWHAHEMAYAGTRLYPMEDDYTGLVALDPDDPDVAVISTNADPVTGKPLISKTDGLRHWELYRGKTADGGKAWKWTAITRDSKVDNLRPLIPANPGGKRVILWCRGDFKSYGNYRLDVCGIAEAR
ncbi:MAG: BNR-4 repeat-containing protein, partial [Planctomycetota bacterium]